MTDAFSPDSLPGATCPAGPAPPLSSSPTAADPHRLLFEAAADALVLIDNATGQILEVNEAATTLYGYSRDALLQLKNIDLSAEPDQTRHATAEARPWIPLRYHRTQDGTVFPVEITARHLLWAGRPAHLAAIRDSSARVQAEAALAARTAQLEAVRTVAQQDLAGRTLAEAALRESEAQYRQLVEGTADLVTVMDAQGRLTFVNGRVAEVFGLPPAACLGRSAFAFVHPDDRERTEAWFKALLTAREARGGIENRLVSVAGEVRHMLWTSTVHYDAAGASAQIDGIARDITARKQLEEERLIRSKLESTGILAGGIAHDFNNLLTVILGSLELLAAPGADHAALRDEATRAVEAAHAITQQFLTFAQGGAPLRRVTPLVALLRDAAAEALRGSPVACAFRIPDGLWPVLGDPGQLGQVIRNLVLNAREAMPTGGRLTVQAETLAGPTPAVGVTLIDSGPGIPTEILPRIFDPYFSTRQRGEQRGMGLGLTVARVIVEKPGGTLTVTSSPGQGTTVLLTLPAAPSSPQAPASPVATGRLLLMDDEPALRTIAAALLRQLGYTVEVAATGEAAVACYQTARDCGEPFAGVILDLTVRGGMGGVETLQALRHLDPAVRALVSSGSADSPALLDPARHGFQGALAKPYRLAELRERCATLLEG